jgi:chromosome segregation ATPase
MKDEVELMKVIKKVNNRINKLEAKIDHQDKRIDAYSQHIYKSEEDIAVVEALARENQERLDNFSVKISNLDYAQVRFRERIGDLESKMQEVNDVLYRLDSRDNYQYNQINDLIENIRIHETKLIALERRMEMNY